jgi:hypothetical protein
MKTVLKEKLRLPPSNLVGRLLRSERGISLIVVIMLMVIILAITGAGLLFSNIDLRVSGNYRVGTQAFYAADMGVSAGFAQIPSSALIPRTPATGAPAYCSGTIASTGGDCATPQPLTFTPISVPGFSLGAGTGYSFYLYQIDATGVGPLGATRQVQALAQYGPVPN